ncbi:MAG: HYR domain-containing protein [Thermomicrobiales bacterium]
MRRLLPALLVAVLALASLPVRAQEDVPATQATGGGEAGPPLDTTPPTLVMPEDMIVAAADASGAVVWYVMPSATDETDGEVSVTCDFPPGTLFPLGANLVTCWAQDASGNQASATFTITVLDQTPPVISVPADIVLDAADASGAAVSFSLPVASDNVDGWVDVTCDNIPGAFFPVGTSMVTCWAQDSSGNQALPVTFAVTVLQPPPPPPPPTEEPPPTFAPPPTDEPFPTEVPPTAAPTLAPPTLTPTLAPTLTPTTSPYHPPTPTPPRIPTATLAPPFAPTPTQPPRVDPIATATATAPLSEVPPLVPTPTATATAPPTPASIPDALPLPLLPQGPITVSSGGPLGGLSEIWNYLDFPISQEFGRTDFSVSHASWYSFGLDYGLDGAAHSGLDIAMPAGTLLYSPIDGTVVISGDTPYYTFYGNGEPNVGELLLQTDDGNQVILGHMSRIAVNVGDRVRIGQFVGLSGGFNGDHVHLETREVQSGGGYRIVDPRTSFLVGILNGHGPAGPAVKHPEAPILVGPTGTTPRPLLEGGRQLVRGSKTSATTGFQHTMPHRVPHAGHARQVRLESRSP